MSTSAALEPAPVPTIGGHRLVFMDLEGTGVDPYHDRIVEIAMFGADGQPLLHTLVDPQIPIPPETTEIHGITDEDVAGQPMFPALARQVERILAGSTIVGYSSMRYDTPLIDAELRRAGRPGLPRDENLFIDVPEIDLYNVWAHAEPRTLVGAAARFAGVDLSENAHRADADTKVLPAVLRGMLAEFGGGALPPLRSEDGQPNWMELMRGLRELSRPEWMVDRDGKFRREEDGTIVFGFSQNRGRPVHHHASFLEWMLKKDFSPETRAFARRFLDEVCNSS